MSQVSTQPTEENVSWRHYEPMALHRVLEASLAAFRQAGYHGTSVREIADRMGVTIPAIYYHFENKQALLVALLITGMEDLLDRIRSAIADTDGTPRAQLQNFVECIVLWSTHRADIAALDHESHSLERHNRNRYIGLRDEVENILIGILREGRKEGDMRPMNERIVTNAILSSCRGVSAWYREGGPLAPDDIAREMAAISMRIVLEDEES